MSIYVCYHKNCTDGFGAAYAAWRRLKDKAIYMPCAYGDDPFEQQNYTIGGEGDLIYMLDWSMPYDNIMELVNRGAKVRIVDHHKTAEKELEKIPGLMDLRGEANKEMHWKIFDMKHSGAYLAWELFHPDKPVPQFIKYLEDRDLWKWNMPYSREFSAGLRLYDMNFERWHKFIIFNEIKELQKEGGIALKIMKKHIDDMIENNVSFALVKVWPGEQYELTEKYIVPVLNTSVYFSEVCEALRIKYPDAPFTMCYGTKGDEISGDVNHFSFRSQGDFDVSEIAKFFGGGGHKNAAGAKVTDASSRQVIEEYVTEEEAVEAWDNVGR